MRPFGKRSGFTLFEMLLALALTAVLLTIVSVTIGSVLRDNQRLESMRAEPTWLSSAVELIRSDLQQAEAYQLQNGVLTLRAHASTTNSFKSKTTHTKIFPHDPVMIEYRLLTVEGSNWLVRRTLPVWPALSNATYSFELLCGGVQDMLLAPQMNSDDSRPLPIRRVASSVDPNEPQMLPVPEQLMLSFTLTHTQQDTGTRAQQPPPHRDTQNPQPQTFEYVIVTH